MERRLLFVLFQMIYLKFNKNLYLSGLEMRKLLKHSDSFCLPSFEIRNALTLVDCPKNCDKFLNFLRFSMNDSITIFGCENRKKSSQIFVILVTPKENAFGIPREGEGVKGIP